MALTIDKIKDYWLPLNVSRRNNFNDFRTQLAVYNDSVSLYQAIKLVFEEQVTDTGTDLSTTINNDNIFIASSTGSGVSLLGASGSGAGLMTVSDKLSLTALNTLSGVAAQATNLGTFTGGIILDSRTIKQALQDLETAIENGTGLPLGDLTSENDIIEVHNGANSIFIPTGVSIEFKTNNLSLSSLSGQITLPQIDSGGAATTDYLSFNGTY